MKKVLGILTALASALLAPGAFADPGDLSMTFTQTRPIQDGVFGLCGETDHFVRLSYVDSSGELVRQFEKTSTMRTRNDTFCIGCSNGLRQVENDVSLAVTRPIGMGRRVSYVLELHDVADGVCDGGLLDLTPGSGSKLTFEVDFASGEFLPLHPDAYTLPSGEHCLVNPGNGGLGLCWLPTVEVYPIECDPAAPCAPTDPPGTVVEVSPGAFVSQLDNPRAVFSLPLGAGQEVLREGGTSTTRGFELQLFATPAATDADPLGQTELFAVNHHAVTLSRTKRTDSVPPTAYFPGEQLWFETTPLRLGYEPTALDAAKRVFASGGSEFAPPQSWRLSADTLVVPVDVVVGYPASGFPPYTVEDLAQLFDGEPCLTENCSEQPLASDNQLSLPSSRLWHPDLQRLVGGKRDFSPDAIFAQCGIQFRLRSVISLPIVDAIYDAGAFNVLNGEGAECLETFLDHGEQRCLRAYTPADANNACKDHVQWIPEMLTVRAGEESRAREDLITGGQFTGEPQGGVTVVLVDRLSAVRDAKCVGTKDGRADASAFRWAAVSVRGQSSNTLSHELGHLLLREGNKAHPPESTQDESDLLMGNGTIIPGCANWSRTETGDAVGCDLSSAWSTNATSSYGCSAMRQEALKRALGAVPSEEASGAPFEMESKPQSWSHGRWTGGSIQPAGFSAERASEGLDSLVAPSGYQELVSPAFGTAEVSAVGSSMSLDVFLPTTFAGIPWAGSVALVFDHPATSTSAWMGQVELSGLPAGQWSTLTFPVPTAVSEALLGDHPAAQFVVVSNTPVPGLLLDGLRFSGELEERAIDHQSGSDGLSVETSALLSFENLADWTSAAVLALDNAIVSEGTSSLSVSASGWTPVESRWFSGSEIPEATDLLSLDVYIPNPQPNPWWIGEVAVFAECPSAGVYNVPLGNVPLQHLFHDEYNQITFDLPPAVRTALTQSSCKLQVVLNVSSGAGMFRLDRLGFL